VNDRAVAARRFSEDGALPRIAEGAIAAVDLRQDLLHEVVRVSPDRRRIDVLITPEACPAVGKDGDDRPHLPSPRKTFEPFGHGLFEGLPVEMSAPGPHEPDEIDEDRKRHRPPPVVLRRQVDRHIATVGIAESVPLQRLRIQPEVLDPTAQFLSLFQHASSLRRRC
jgi:hypothetical protein